MFIKNTPIYEGLEKYNVYKEDIDNSIFNVSSLPEVFPLGKSYFLITGSEQLKNLTDIKIEILDKNKNTISYSVPNYLESFARAVSVNITEDVETGPITITILGTLSDVPEEWEGTFNVRWTRTINANPFLTNVNKIQFYSQPEVSVKEKVNLFVEYESASFANVEFSSGSIKGYPKTVLNPVYGRITKYVISTEDTDFNYSFQNGTLTIPNPVVKKVIEGEQSGPKKYITGSFSSTISNVYGSKLLNTSELYYIYNIFSEEYEIAEIEPTSDYTITYTQDVPASETIQSESYAEVELKSLNTFSGKVDSVKVYKNNIGSRSNWELLGQFQIDNHNLLSVETDSTPIQSGYIVNQDVIDYFWSVIEVNGTPNEPIEWDSSSLMNSMDLRLNEANKIKYNYELPFLNDTKYTLEFNARLIDSNGKLEVWMSGSSFNKANDLIGTLSSTAPEYFIQYKIDFDSISNGTGYPVFYPKVGKWFISDIKIYASTDWGNSPSYSKIYIPIQPKRRNTGYRFKVEYINPTGDVATEQTVINEPVFFGGENTYIDGAGNLITGSLCIGNALYSGIEFAGTNSAYIRNIGYEGWANALAGTGNGFMIWSGSVMPTSSNDYQGVGIELIADSESYFRFRTSPAELDVRVSAFFVGDPNSQFISGANGNIEISSSNFHLVPTGDLILSGTIYAGSGEIGGWQILPDKLQSANDSVMLSGSGVISASNFYVSELGNVTASNANIQGEIRADSGYIGEWILDDGVLSGSNITLDASGSSIYMTSDPDNYYIDFTPSDQPIGGNQYYVKFGPNFAVSSSGVLIASGAVIEGILTASAGYIAGWNIGTNALYKDSVDGSTGMSTLDNIRFFAGSDSRFTSDVLNGPYYVLSDGTIKATKGLVGGWELGEDYISSSNLILNASGSIYSSNYISNKSGWLISSLGNGYAEFENVKVRGTLSTTVFEKETINAVGGQLWIANATTLSSNSLDSTTTMSVANASSFTTGEILLVKAFSDTGFSTEYMLVQSASIDDTNTGAGKLYVVRGYGNGVAVPPNHPEVDIITSVSRSYDEGQVIVSTGKIGSGWVRINANPNDTTTPYIDIVERTGSGLYDTELEARIGDLSGISSTLLYGETNPGFGIYTNNGFFKGTITAMTGSFLGKVHAGDLIIGSDVNGTNDGIYINDWNYWYDTGYLNIGNNTNYLNWNGAQLEVAGIINIIGGNAATTSSLNDVSSSLAGDLADVSQSFSSSLSNVSGSLSTTISNTSSSLASSITGVSSSLADRIVTDANNLITKPNPAPIGEGLFLAAEYMGYYSGSSWDAYISSSGEFLFKADDDNLISFGNDSFILKVSDQATLSGSNINLITPSFFFGDSNTYLSGSGGDLEISSSNFLLSSSGDVFINGTITSDAGAIAGWTIDDKRIYKDNTFLASSGSYWNSYGDKEEAVIGSPWYGDVIVADWAIDTLYMSASYTPESGSTETNVAVFEISEKAAEIIPSLTVGDIYELEMKYQNRGGSNASIEIYQASGPNSGSLYKRQYLTTFTNYNWSTINITLQAPSTDIEILITAGEMEAAPIGSIGWTGELFVPYISLTRYIPFVEISEHGFHAFRSPKQQIKIGKDEIIIYGADLEVDDVTIKGDLYVLGQSYVAANNLLGTTANNFTIDTDDTSATYVELRFGNNAGYVRYNKAEDRLEINKDFVPVTDGSQSLGSTALRWEDIYSVQTTTGGLFEVGLRTLEIKDYETGTVLVWKDGKLVPCHKDEDESVMGVSKKGKDVPLVLGAEPILVTGKIKEGDFIGTSSKNGHGKAIKKYLLFNKWIKRNITGKVIAQALESFEGESGVIKAMIMKI